MNSEYPPRTIKLKMLALLAGVTATSSIYAGGLEGEFSGLCKSSSWGRTKKPIQVFLTSDFLKDTLSAIHGIRFDVNNRSLKPDSVETLSYTNCDGKTIGALELPCEPKAVRVYHRVFASMEDLSKLSISVSSYSSDPILLPPDRTYTFESGEDGLFYTVVRGDETLECELALVNPLSEEKNQRFSRDFEEVLEPHNFETSPSILNDVAYDFSEFISAFDARWNAEGLGKVFQASAHGLGPKLGLANQIVDLIDETYRVGKPELAEPLVGMISKLNPKLGEFYNLRMGVKPLNLKKDQIKPFTAERLPVRDRLGLAQKELLSDRVQSWMTKVEGQSRKGGLLAQGMLAHFADKTPSFIRPAQMGHFAASEMRGQISNAGVSKAEPTMNQCLSSCRNQHFKEEAITVGGTILVTAAAPAATALRTVVLATGATAAAGLNHESASQKAEACYSGCAENLAPKAPARRSAEPPAPPTGPTVDPAPPKADEVSEVQRLIQREEDRIKDAKEESEKLEAQIKAKAEASEKDKADKAALEKAEAEAQAKIQELQEIAAEKKAKAEKEQAERERAEKEQADRKKAEKERAEKERAEKERAEKERAEKERAEKAKIERDRMWAEADAALKEKQKSLSSIDPNSMPDRTRSSARTTNNDEGTNDPLPFGPRRYDMNIGGGATGVSRN